ncbi:MAG: RibD family protein [Thermoanaerobaculales bacterium]|nr:RibD family protein [Thermoanaerobaculales bacterium]
MKSGPTDPRHSHGEIPRRTESGIDVNLDYIENPARRLSSHRLRRIVDDRSWITLVARISLDGRRATKTGDSGLMIGEEGRLRCLELREEHDAVLVGVGTILADDPDLSCRPEMTSTDDWRRIVLDSQLRTPSWTKVVRSQPENTLIVHTPAAAGFDKERLGNTGVALLEMPASPSGMVAIKPLLRRLSRDQIRSVLVEGGPTVLGSFADQYFIDEAIFFLSPHIFGGDSPSAVGGIGVSRLANACRLRFEVVRMVGADVEIRAIRPENSEEDNVQCVD